MAKQKKRRPGPGGPGRPQPKPHWQPIEALAMVAAHIDGMLQADREQYETLLEAKPKPHVLDDFTINRVIAAFTTQRNDFGLFDQQLRRWAALPLSDQQRREVERLVEQMRLLRENNERVLTLARELSKGTIDKVMAKSDVELGLEFLLQLTEQEGHKGKQL
ncbi:MAG TPA: hypothetical protein VKR06_45805 [Ktedonosporobacter sp.]|nr:hypothetical protein [Ktedonosporobacter sp.]